MQQVVWSGAFWYGRVGEGSQYGTVSESLEYDIAASTWHSLLFFSLLVWPFAVKCSEKSYSDVLLCSVNQVLRHAYTRKHTQTAKDKHLHRFTGLDYIEYPQILKFDFT